MLPKKTVIHYEGGAAYYNKLKEQYTIKSTAPYANQTCDYIRELYSNNPLINYDIVGAWRVELGASGNYNQYDMRYDNLYTYVLLCGVMIPYYNWIYDYHYLGPKYSYWFDDKTGKGTREIRATKIPEGKYNSAIGKDYIAGVDLANGKDMTVITGRPVYGKTGIANRSYK